ncbi:hypothetical protein SNE40_014189 [Patella caerulea]|uniref:Reverse transcriptase domain-containing protein n=1 Tax=Patella caerulea TaxID=87958 RepID=A0AAN8PSE2_PATCE
MKFGQKSNWTPKFGTDPTLESFIRAVKSEFRNLKVIPFKRSNLSKDEREALFRLRNNPNIIIKKADKGSAVVIQNTPDYIKEAHRQLSDSKFYKKLDADPTSKQCRDITLLLSKMYGRKEITEKILTGLIPTDAEPGRFYLLPKIHKCLVPGKVPGRPIISGNGTSTERISAFIDEHIKELVPYYPSYVKDTTHFIQKVENFTPKGSDILLVTMDVTSLYTNIPNRQGILHVARAIRKHKPQWSISPTYLLKLLEFVLQNNVFTFNDEIYHQISGTAMGSPVACSFSTIFLGELEEILLKQTSGRSDLYVRYIDDIFMIWPHGEARLERFIKEMNSMHDTIKFTAEYSRERVSFLDTWVNFNQISNKLHFDLYNKPTDSHSYLLYTSCHPSHIKTKGPFSQFLRLKRICSLETDYERHSQNLLNSYLKRGYPHKVVSDNKNRAKSLARKDLLSPTTATAMKKRKSLVFITDYNPTAVQVSMLLKEKWHLLSGSDMCRPISNIKPITAFRRNPNLKDTLMKARLIYPPWNPQTSGTTVQNLFETCIKKDCDICNKLYQNTHFFSGKTGKKYSCRSGYNCLSRNIVYLLTCSLCKKQYIGESKRAFSKRFKEHYADIRHNRPKPVALHFNLDGHSCRNVMIKIIELFKTDPNNGKNDALRKANEFKWIHTLRTFAPDGINNKM